MDDREFKDEVLAKLEDININIGHISNTVQMFEDVQELLTKYLKLKTKAEEVKLKKLMDG